MRYVEIQSVLQRNLAVIEVMVGPSNIPELSGKAMEQVRNAPHLDSALGDTRSRLTVLRPHNTGSRWKDIKCRIRPSNPTTL
jgi:hypothetical protein